MLSPKPIALAGVLLAATGVVLDLVVPMFLTMNPGVRDQATLYAINVALGLLRGLAIPFGASFVGAALVMAYLDLRPERRVEVPLHRD